MIRLACAVALSALVLSSVGCTMCQHPYDYCGPTFSGNNCVPCDPMARAGSGLSPPVPITSGGYAHSQMLPPGATEGEVIETDEGLLMQGTPRPGQPVPLRDRTAGAGAAVRR